MISSGFEKKWNEVVETIVLDASLTAHQRKKAKATANEFLKSLLEIRETEGEHSPYHTVLEPDDEKLAERVTNLEEQIEELSSKVAKHRTEIPSLVEKYYASSLEVEVENDDNTESLKGIQDEDALGYDEELLVNFQDNFTETIGLLRELKQTLPATLNKAIKVNQSLGESHKPTSTVDRTVEQTDTSKSKSKKRKADTVDEGKSTRQQLAATLQKEANAFVAEHGEPGFW